MPTVYSYCSDLGASYAFYGLVLSVFSITRMIVFIPVGRWADKRPYREVFAVTCFLSLVGCFLYGIAGYAENKWLLIIGRILSGLGASNTTLSRTYISQVCTADEFSKRIGLQMTLDLFGVMVGPALIAIILKVDFTLWGWFQFNPNTAPGYIMAVVNLILMVLFWFFLEEVSGTNSSWLALSRSGLIFAFSRFFHFFLLVMSCWTLAQPNKQRPRKSIRRASLDLGLSEAERLKNSQNMGAVKRVFLKGGGWFFVFTCMSDNFNLCALETVAAPITGEQFGWGKMELSAFFACCAGVGCMGMILGVKLEKWFKYGLVPIAIGLACMVSAYIIWLIFDSGDEMAEGPFLIAAGLCILGLCVITPANSGLYTKVVENQGGAQGLFGGIWSVFMSAGKR